jgi:hypothetical protein
MDFKQSTMGELIKSERQMVLTAPQRYGDFYLMLRQLTTCSSIASDRDRALFALFASQAKKPHTLALFSFARLHQVQGSMDLRQVREAGASSSYAIAKMPGDDLSCR